MCKTKYLENKSSLKNHFIVTKVLENSENFNLQDDTKLAYEIQTIQIHVQ